MASKDREISSVGDLLDALQEAIRPRDVVWYRGHADWKWKLVPSLGRDGSPGISAEALLIKRFRQNAVPHLPVRPDQEWEWLFLMQHHGAPTRLLDWTESPLVALYFAVSDPKHDGKKGALWCLFPCKLNDAANVRFDLQGELPSFGVDEILEGYSPSRLAAEQTSQMGPVAAIGPRSSARMTSQLAVFTISHRNLTPIDRIGDGTHALRLLIPAKKKKAIARELAILGIDRLSLFPELDSVALTAKAGL